MRLLFPHLLAVIFACGEDVIVDEIQDGGQWGHYITKSYQPELSSEYPVSLPSAVLSNSLVALAPYGTPIVLPQRYNLKSEENGVPYSDWTFVETIEELGGVYRRKSDGIEFLLAVDATRPVLRVPENSQHVAEIALLAQEQVSVAREAALIAKIAAEHATKEAAVAKQQANTAREILAQAENEARARLEPRELFQSDQKDTNFYPDESNDTRRIEYEKNCTNDPQSIEAFPGLTPANALLNELPEPLCHLVRQACSQQKLSLSRSISPLCVGLDLYNAIEQTQMNQGNMKIMKFNEQGGGFISQISSFLPWRHLGDEDYYKKRFIWQFARDIEALLKGPDASIFALLTSLKQGGHEVIAFVKEKTEDTIYGAKEALTHLTHEEIAKLIYETDEAIQAVKEIIESEYEKNHWCRKAQIEKLLLSPFTFIHEELEYMRELEPFFDRALRGSPLVNPAGSSITAAIRTLRELPRYLLTISMEMENKGMMALEAFQDVGEYSIYPGSVFVESLNGEMISLAPNQLNILNKQVEFLADLLVPPLSAIFNPVQDLVSNVVGGVFSGVTT